MASEETPFTPSSAPSLGTSQSHENRSSAGQSSLVYQPNTYYPHLYTPYYVPCSYCMQPTVQAASAEPPVMPDSPNPTVVLSARVYKATRRGRALGSQNWSPEDVKALAYYVERASPELGAEVWQQIEGRYNKEYAIPNDRQQRRWENIRDKWNKIITNGPPPTGADYRPVADREDLPGVEGTGRDNANGNDELDADGADHTQAPPANETFVISRPDTESDSGSDGDGDGGSSTTKHGPASSGLAETYPSHISHYTAAWQNCDGPATFVYRQRIWELEMQNNALYREAAMLRDKLFSTERKLDRAERRGDKFELHVKMLEMMGTHRGRSHRHHRTHRRLSRSPSSDSSRSRSVSRNKRRRMDSPVNSKTLEKGEERAEYQDEEDEEAAASLVSL